MNRLSENAGSILLVGFVCLTCIASRGLAQADGALSQIEQRVAGRSGEISKLRNDGLVKENTNGMLEPAAQLTEQQDALLKEENRDRSAAFTLVAEENGLTRGDVVQLFNSGSRANSAAPSSSSSPGPVQTAPSQAATPAGQGPSPAPASGQPSTANPPSQSPSSTANPSASPSSPASSTTAATQPPPTIDNSLPAKLINRPASSLYSDASEASTKVQENMQGFMVYYIVDQSPGWHQVASSEGGLAEGWLKESEVILWQHNLAVRFAHEARGDRLQVPFFGSSQELESVLRMGESERLAVNRSAAGNPDQKKAIEVGVVAVQPPLVSRNEFYVLPIVQHQKVSAGQFPGIRRPAMMLRVAAMKQQGSAAPAPQASSAGRLPAIDVVFVMDLTSSMGPFVQATLEAMRNLSDKLESEGLADSFRFGLWGYKDKKPDEDFGSGEVTRNFTQSLQGRDEFIRTLQQVRVSRSSAGDWPEAVFYGVNDAIQKTNWTPNAMKVIIVVGDASSHPLSDQQKNPDRLSEGTVRTLATDKRCYIMPVYIKADSPAARDDADKARPQFMALGRNPNVGGSGAMAVIERGGSSARFKENLDAAFANLVNDMRRAANGEISQSAAGSSSASPSNMADLAQSIFRGAYLDWLAAQTSEGETIAPELQGWAFDKDLVNTDTQALDVVFLITRSQLDTLKKSLDRIIDAGVRSQVRGTDFFAAIQNIVGQAAVNPSQLSSPANSDSIKGFLQGLPYDSEVLSLTADEWRKMTPQDREALLDRCQSQITYYETVNADTTLWRPLNEGDDPTAYVAAIPLDRLP
jgi:serine/threonine-protein kinase PpkA